MYPILFEFSFITVFALWFFVAIGYVAGALITLNLAKRTRVRLDLITDNSITLFLSTLIVSRIVFIATHTEIYFYNFQTSSLMNAIAIWDKGISFWGAVLGWVLGIIYLSKKYNESPLRLFDIVSPGLLIGIFFGNIGAFFDGINFGIPTNLPWGVTFLSANVKYISPVHPTQLYGAVYSLALGLFLIYLAKKIRGELPGFISEIGIFVFSFAKFLEEFIRGDDSIIIIGVRLPQIIAFCGILYGGYLIYLRYTNKNGKDPGGILKKTISDILNRIKSFQKQNREIALEVPSSLQNQPLSDTRF